MASTPPKSRHRKALLIRLVIGAILANALACALVGAYLVKSRSGYEEQALTTADNLSRALEINYTGRLDKINVALFALANETERHLATGNYNPAELNAYMLRHRTATPELDGLWVSNRDGWIHEGTRVTAGKPIDIRDREYFRRQAQQHATGLVLSKPVMGRVTKEWSILMSRRINQPDGGFAGIALGSLPFVKEFNGIFSTLDVGSNGVLSLRDEQLTTILRYPSKGTPAAQIGARDISAEARAAVAKEPLGGSYRALSKVDGIERIFSYRKIGPYPWYIIVGISIDDTLVPWKREVGLLAAILLFFCLASIFFALNILQRTEEMFSLDLMEKRNESLEELVKERTAQLEVEKLAAEAANRTKSIFLGNMSHELRTPLNAVIGFSQLMTSSANLSDEEKVNAGIILRSGQHLLILINDILELTKIEAGRASLNKSSVNLSIMLHEVVDMISIGAKQAGLVLTLNCEGLPMAVSCDGVKLRQVLLNLLANAVKFTEHGSVTLDVHARQIEAHLCALTFAVHDSGIGIRKDDLDRIFEPFVQSDNALAKVGTGLGLTISRDFVDMMGGSLQVDSELGAGSIFHFTLELETSGTARHMPPAPGEAPKHVLSPRKAEPDPIDMSTLRDQLARLPQETRAQLRLGLQHLDLNGVGLIIERIAGEHPAVTAIIEQLLRQHQYPMLCSLLDEVQNVSK
ncbi:MAG: ATP-binding protein [Pseudomonadota bacterium]